MIDFYCLIPTDMPPHPASRSANGTLPIDGYRYCEPLRQASSFGWHVHLPVDLWLYWDGAETEWSIDEGATWYPLAAGVQYPGFSDAFNAHAPADCAGYAPPFLAKGADHDILQIWTGTVARTQPGTQLLVRPPANLQWRTDYSVLEGIIATDQWFGPLFTNIRLRKMNSPIVLRACEPLLQLQPVPADVLQRLKSEDAGVHQGPEALGDTEWSAFQNTVVRRVETRKKLGDYATDIRRKAKAAH